MIINILLILEFAKLHSQGHVLVRRVLRERADLSSQRAVAQRQRDQAELVQSGAGACQATVHREHLLVELDVASRARGEEAKTREGDSRQVRQDHRRVHRVRDEHDSREEAETRVVSSEASREKSQAREGHENVVDTHELSVCNRRNDRYTQNHF